jgi:hypothetical protein
LAFPLLDARVATPDEPAAALGRPALAAWSDASQTRREVASAPPAASSRAELAARAEARTSPVESAAPGWEALGQVAEPPGEVGGPERKPERTQSRTPSRIPTTLQRRRAQIPPRSSSRLRW